MESAEDDEVPEEDIIALVVASLPQDLLERILKEEEMIGKGWEETKKSIVREAERHRIVEPIQRPFYREHRRMEANNAEPHSENCFVCNDPRHRKRDCPVFKASLIGKGINPDEYQAEYDRKGAGSSGGGPNRGGSSQSRGGGGSGHGAYGSGRGHDSGRGNADRGRGRSAPTHYGPTQQVAQAHAVSVSCIRCQQKGYLATARASV